MPKMKIVTDAMLEKAATIGQDTANILEKQNMVTSIFSNMGKNFSGNIPSLMTQHMCAMDKEYTAINRILGGYKDFLEYSANNYDWKEDELARAAAALGNGNTAPHSGTNTNINSSSETNSGSNTNANTTAGSTQTGTSTSPDTAVQADFSDKWGWNTQNLPFSHNTPDMSSSAYQVSNSIVKVNTRELYNEWAGEDRVNCVYYARARYLEVNGGDEYPYSKYQTINDPEYIKNGNCVVRLDGHSVYVEHYDSANDVVWFSDSNMGSHPDGALQSMSFEEFKKFNGGFQYAEGSV